MAAGETPSPALGAGLPRLFPLGKFPPLTSLKAVSKPGSSPLTLGQQPSSIQDGKRSTSAPNKVDGNSSLQANNKQLNHRSFLEAALGAHERQPFHDSYTSFEHQQLSPESLNPVSSYQGKPAVLFSTSEKTSLIEKVNYVLIGKFSHGRPSLVDLKAFFVGLKLVGKYNISIFDNKHVFIELELKFDYNRIWLHLAWTIKGFAMRIFKWDSDFSPSFESAVAPVWIRLEGLPLYLFDVKSLCSIANAIGKPLRVDPLNVNRIRLNSARVCVELNVAMPLPDAIWIGFGEGESMEGFWVKVYYDVLPHFCSFCNHMGHSLEQCRRKHGAVTDVLMKETTSGPSQVWYEVKKKPNDDPVLHCKGQEFAPPVHTVETGTSLGNSSYTALSTGAVLAAADLGNDTMAISIVERTCTSGQNKEQVTKEQIVGKISERGMEKKHEAANLVDCLQSVKVTNKFTALDDSNEMSQQLERVEADQQEQIIQGSDLAAEPKALMDYMKQNLNHSVTSGQLEVVDQASYQDSQQQGNKDGQAPDTQTDIEQLHQSPNSDIADQIGLHLQQDVQVVDQATNQGIVEVAGLDVCSAMVVWEGTATTEDDKAAAKHTPVPTSSKQMVEVDIHLQKTPYTPSILAAQQGDKDGEVSTNKIDKFAEHKGDQPQPKTAVEVSPQNADTEVIVEWEGAAEQGGIGVAKIGEITTLATDQVGLKSEAINVLDEDTSTQEWQLVGKKINKTKGVVTRSQTKNANSTWADKVEDDQVVDQTPISTMVQAGNKSTQDSKTPTKSRYQIQRKVDKLFSRLSSMNMRDGIRRQLRAELQAHLSELKALDEGRSLLS